MYVVRISRSMVERIEGIARGANEAGQPPSASDIATVFTPEQVAEIVDASSGWGNDFSLIAQAWCDDFVVGDSEHLLLENVEMFFDGQGIAYEIER